MKKNFPSDEIDVTGMNPEELEALLPPNYEPSENEEFMSPLQRAYFYRQLKLWRSSILSDAESTLENLRKARQEIEDEVDTAFLDSHQALELRARDRQRKLLSKIDEAIARVLGGSYGYCRMTGEPIELKRLTARPIAEFSIEGQEMHEREENMKKRTPR